MKRLIAFVLFAALLAASIIPVQAAPRSTSRYFEMETRFAVTGGRHDIHFADGHVSNDVIWVFASHQVRIMWFDAQQNELSSQCIRGNIWNALAAPDGARTFSVFLDQDRQATIASSHALWCPPSR